MQLPQFMYKLSRTLLVLLALAPGPMAAQLVSWTPAYPSLDDSLVILFDASQGNGNLAGVADVFAHTGLLNQYSTDVTDWQHQASAWTSGYDSLIVMTNLGNNMHEFRLRPRNFYGVGANEEVRALAFVFRNEDGSLSEKDPSGSDIFIPIYASNGFAATFAAPMERPEILGLNDQLPLEIRSNQPSLITVYQDGLAIGQSSGLVQDYSLSIPASAYGKFKLHFTADNGVAVVKDTLSYIVQPPVSVANPPSGIRDGINYTSSTSVVLQLLAPNKDYVYAIGDFSDWEMEPEYLMHKTPDGERHWIEITGLTAGEEVRFQYFVDHKVKVGDPYAQLVLDEFNDNGVNSIVYPNLIPYPSGKTTELVTVMQPDAPSYNWQTQNFQRPDSRDLVVYELLVRDFVIRHNFETVIDSLDYLAGLGVNAIELLPINEFDGNQSWGYGPAYYFAPDKYYGPKESVQRFVDECHARGIAVILDVVFNHSFSQSPFVRLYYDKNTDKVTPDNPWYNVEAPHPLGLGYDLDHASFYTQDLVDSVLGFWADEYRVDGYRFDLSKGFTNKPSGNLGDWGAYDSDRVYFLKRIANKFWPKYPGTYLILEHFADNFEETDLANFGFMFWGNANKEYAQGTMGWEQDSDFSFGVSYQARNWALHNLMGFMESHDEERLMFENIHYGNSFNASHDCKDTTIALQRMGMAAALFFTIPGPKMIWQFGELGYDYSIDFGDRTSPKPVRWDYLNDPRRLKLKKIYAALIKLKTNYPNTFRSNVYSISAWGKQKQVWVSGAMNVTVTANFDVVDQNTFTGFQHDGWWYEYLSGDSLYVTDVNMTIPLGPGEYRVFTDQRLPLPDLDVSNPVGEAEAIDLGREMVIYPNPCRDWAVVELDLDRGERCQVRLLDMRGMEVLNRGEMKMSPGKNFIELDVESLAAGTYLLQVRGESFLQSSKLRVLD